MVASGHRAVDRCDALGGGPFSDSADYLFRPYLGLAHLAAIAQVRQWMHEAGMATHIDAAGNLIGRYGEGEKTLLIGSHIDSVRDAGRYDGPLGVMLGIEVVAALNAAGRQLPFAIEVCAFGDEEGSRFPAPMLCSRAVAGTLDAAALNVADADGVSLAQALTLAGLSIADFPAARRDPSTLLGYLEAHIEQGPVLEAEGLALGIVTAIAGQKRFEVVVTGVAGHAGTNSMDLRRDALTAAAEIVLAVENVARDGDGALVATVGRLRVEPGAPNVVPGRVEFTIDVRHGTQEVLDKAAEDIIDAIHAIAGRRPVDIQAHLVHSLPPAPCHPKMREMLAQAAASVGVRPRDIVSGAGHDAMIFSPLVPTAMLFIRCKDGISHNPLESVDPADADLAFKAMLAFIDRLEASYA